MLTELKLFSCLSLLLVTAPDSIGEDWYRWRGPRLDGVSLEDAWDHSQIQREESTLWKQNVGTGFSSLVIQDGLLFTLGNSDETDTVFCFDARSGKPVWTFDYASPLDDREFDGGPTSTPTIDDDKLFVLSRTGDLFCMATKTGKLIWQSNVVDDADVRVPGWGFSASPLVTGKILLINAGDAGVAYNKETGKLIWKSADKDSGYGTPVVLEREGKRIAVIPSGRSYVAVTVNDGTELWRQRWLTTFGCNAADPIVLGKEIFVCSGYNRGAALLNVENNKPEISWKNKLMQNQISASILLNDFLYGVNGDIERGTALTCMSWATGEVAWSEDSVSPGAIAASKDRLIVISTTGELSVVKADSARFVTLAKRNVLDGKCWTPPVISNSTIYCRSAVGDVVAVDVQREL